MATDWQMPRRSESCMTCGQKFDIGQVFCVSLLETDEGYERQDYCLECDPETIPGSIARWRTRRPQPAAQPGKPFDKAAMFELFRKLDGTSDQRQIQFRFVLALLLWRKKVITFDTSSDDDGKELWHFTRPKSDDIFKVEKPELDENQVEILGQQLEMLLSDPPEDIDQFFNMQSQPGNETEESGSSDDSEVESADASIEQEPVAEPTTQETAGD